VSWTNSSTPYGPPETMKYVAAASDKTVSLRREPFCVFRIFCEMQYSIAANFQEKYYCRRRFPQKRADQKLSRESTRKRANWLFVFIRVNSRLIKTIR
jgi:hypothetical protein